MAKHTVTHSCGHDQEHQVYGPGRDRERKLNWLETTLCTDCWKSQQDANREAGNVAAAAANQLAGLIPLTGSEKQIAWAESIRSAICAVLRAAERDLDTTDLSEVAREEVGGAVALVVDEICGQAEAKWWIEKGQYLDILATNPARHVDHARNWIADQIHERGLAPTAEREAEQIRERQQAEKKAMQQTEWELLSALLPAVRDENLSWDATTDTTSGTADGHTICCVGSGWCATVTVDGATIREASNLRERLLRFRQTLATAKYAADLAARCASLAGQSVTGVKKAKQDLIVTLSDGRVLTGKSSRDGWALDQQREGYRSVALDPAHPEVKRLATDARAWAKQEGVR